MTPRRLLALSIFLVSAFGLVLGVRLCRSELSGYDVLAGLIVSGTSLIGILVAIAIVSGHRTRPFAEDTGLGLVPERAKPGIAVATSALFGLAMWFIALRGLFQNRMESIGANSMAVTWGAAPGKFIAYLVFWVAAGAACMALARFLARAPKASEAPGRGETDD